MFFHKHLLAIHIHVFPQTHTYDYDSDNDAPYPHPLYYCALSLNLIWSNDELHIIQEKQKRWSSFFIQYVTRCIAVHYHWTWYRKNKKRSSIFFIQYVTRWIAVHYHWTWYGLTRKYTLYMKNKKNCQAFSFNTLPVVLLRTHYHWTWYCITRKYVPRCIAVHYHYGLTRKYTLYIEKQKKVVKLFRSIRYPLYCCALSLNLIWSNEEVPIIQEKQKRFSSFFIQYDTRCIGVHYHWTWYMV